MEKSHKTDEKFNKFQTFFLFKIINENWKVKWLWWQYCCIVNHYNPLTDYSTATVVIDWVKNYKFLLQSRLGRGLFFI